jgi:hypothetical protein
MFGYPEYDFLSIGIKDYEKYGIVIERDEEMEQNPFIRWNNKKYEIRGVNI